MHAKNPMKREGHDAKYIKCPCYVTAHAQLFKFREYIYIYSFSRSCSLFSFLPSIQGPVAVRPTSNDSVIAGEVVQRWASPTLSLFKTKRTLPREAAVASVVFAQCWTKTIPLPLEILEVLIVFP